VSRDAVAAGEEQLVSFSAEQSKYCSIFTCALVPCGDLIFMSLGRWPCLRGGTNVGLNNCYAVCGCGKEYRCGALPGGACGDMLEAMARISPRINCTISLDPSFRVEIPEQGSLNFYSKSFSEIQVD
jgi:hypothetical protein